MKRAVELKALSKDHHRALVMALKAKRAAPASSAAIAELWQELAHYYSTELIPHFTVEETCIGIPLVVAGENELVQQLHEEHKAIGRYFESGASRTASELERFGHLLEQHVRFEERELFNVAQAVLSVEQLRSLLE